MSAAEVAGLRPYYEQGGITIYHERAGNLLRSLAGRSVAMILTDPPYNLGIPYPGYEDRLPWEDYWVMADDVLSESARVLRHGGVFAALLPYTAYLSAEVPQSANPRHRGRIGPTVPMLATWTSMAVQQGLLYEDTISVVHTFSGEGEGYAIGTAIGSSSRPKMRMVARALLICYSGKCAVDGRDGRRGGRKLADHKNHWYCRPAWGTGMGHPTPLPTLMVVRALGLWSNPGDLVVDPFCGSGVVLFEAKREGRRALGCDISEQSCEIAARRLAQGVLL